MSIVPHLLSVLWIKIDSVNLALSISRMPLNRSANSTINFRTLLRGDCADLPLLIFESCSERSPILMCTKRPEVMFSFLAKPDHDCLNDVKLVGQKM